MHDSIGDNPLKRSASSPDRQESRYPLRKYRKTEYNEKYAVIPDSDFTDDEMDLNSDESAEDERSMGHDITGSGSCGEGDDSTVVPGHDSEDDSIENEETQTDSYDSARTRLGPWSSCQR